MVFRFGILLMLFDVYVKWFRLEKDQNVNFYDSQSFIKQYLYLLVLCLLGIVKCSIEICIKFFIEFISYVAGITWAIRAYRRSICVVGRLKFIAMTVIISSFGKLFLTLMVIWDYNELEYSWLVNIFVMTSNYQALSGT